MKLLKRELPDNHNIIFYGDTHVGSILSSSDGWKSLVETMHSSIDGCKHNYAMDGGDMIEAIMIDDRRFSPEKLIEPRPLEQAKVAIAARMPIRKQLLSILQGNHEWHLWKYGDMTAYACAELGVEYGTYTAKLTVVDHKGNLMYKVYQTHGRRNITSTADDPIRRQANMRLILKRHLKHKAADCTVMVKHHAHKLLVSKPESELYLYDDGKRVKQGYTHFGQKEQYIDPDKRWYGCGGSFLKLYGHNMSGYAEMAEYDPVELGFLVLKVRDRQIEELKAVYLEI